MPKVEVFYPGPAVTCEIPAGGINYPALGISLLPGTNTLEEDIAAKLIAAGTVTTSSYQPAADRGNRARRVRRTETEEV